MDRRSILTGIAAVGVGGVAIVAVHRTLFPDPADPHTPGVSVHDVTDPGHGIEFAAILVQPVTPAGPAAIETTLQNATSEPWAFQFDRSAPVGTGPRASHTHTDTDTSVSLLTAHHGSVIPDELGADGCWRATGPIVHEDRLGTTELNPDESVTTTYTVLEPHDSDTCLSPGDYRLEHDLPAGTNPDDLDTHLTLGFTLRIDDSA